MVINDADDNDDDNYDYDYIDEEYVTLRYDTIRYNWFSFQIKHQLRSAREKKFAKSEEAISFEWIGKTWEKWFDE